VCIPAHTSRQSPENARTHGKQVQKHNSFHAHSSNNRNALILCHVLLLAPRGGAHEGGGARSPTAQYSKTCVAMSARGGIIVSLCSELSRSTADQSDYATTWPTFKNWQVVVESEWSSCESIWNILPAPSPEIVWWLLGWLLVDSSRFNRQWCALKVKIHG